MKFVLASILVLVALVTVFHAEKYIPIPRAIGCVMNSAVAKHMPFGMQKAYAESCISSLEGHQDQIRYAVSDATVKLRELDRRVTGLRQARDQSVTRLRAMVKGEGDVSEETVTRELARYDDLLWKLTQSLKSRGHVTATLEALESSEGSVTKKLVEFNDRLDVVQIDHEQNNARELADQLSGSAHPGKRNRASHCTKVIEHMEHKERVRDELHRRYAPRPIGALQYPVPDPWERAKQITDGDC